MSKAFVIKNKEGKYFDYWAACFADELDVTCIYLEKEQTKKDIVSCDLKDCEIVEITIAEGNLEQENKHLKRLLDAKEKIETNSIKGFKKLNEENKQLKERIEELESQFDYECECNKDFVACQNENERLKEQLTEQIDYKDEYYHYWQETKKENTILKKALELACKDLSLYEDITTADYKAKCYIEQAKESTK